MYYLIKNRKHQSITKKSLTVYLFWLINKLRSVLFDSHEMSPFMLNVRLPKWIFFHLYRGKTFSKLPVAEKEELKARLSKFCIKDPDVSVVIPAFNEENNIYRTLSSLASNRTSQKVEIIVINNNSSDRTQEILDALGVKSFFQPLQGIAYARQLGLKMASGKYHLCADADTLYPPQWIELMTKPLHENRDIVGVYGRYSIMPPDGNGNLFFWFYNKLTGILFRLRRKRREHINVLGFNMGFLTEIGRTRNGFDVKKVRKYNNAKDSKDYTEVSEDGQMAVQLQKEGKLKMVTDPRARVYTSSRKLLNEGSISKAFFNRLIKHSFKLLRYYSTSKSKLIDNPHTKI